MDFEGLRGSWAGLTWARKTRPRLHRRRDRRQGHDLRRADGEEDLASVAPDRAREGQFAHRRSREAGGRAERETGRPAAARLRHQRPVSPGQGALAVRRRLDDRLLRRCLRRYVVFGDAAGSVRALRIANGSIAWEFKTDDPVYSTPTSPADGLSSAARMGRSTHWTRGLDH